MSMEETERSMRRARRHARRMRGMRRSARFGGFLWGGVLVVVGAWLLADRLGYDIPDVGALWPVFPFMFGMAFLASWIGGDRSDPGPVWPGTFGVLIGLFFFLFSFEVFDWTEMDVLWPVFPLIVGLAFTATWLAGACREAGLLLPAVTMLLVGGGGLTLTLGLLRWRHVEALWPLALIALGGAIVWSALRDRR